jgi:hypothetical protein
MNALSGEKLLKLEYVKAQIEAHARLSLAGRHFPRRLLVFREECGTGGGEGGGVRYLLCRSGT